MTKTNLNKKTMTELIIETRKAPVPKVHLPLGFIDVCSHVACILRLFTKCNR